MKIFKSGDIVYVVTPGYLVESRQRLEAGEPLKVVFDHIKCGLAYVIVSNVNACKRLVTTVIIAIPRTSVTIPDKRLKEIKHLETNILFPFEVSVVAIPIASDPLFCYREEFRIRPQEFPVNRGVQKTQVVPYDVKYFNHVLSRELNDKRRNPDMIVRNDSRQMLFTNEAVVMPC